MLRVPVVADTDTGTVSVGVIPPLGVASASRCPSISSALCQRSAGFFSRHRITRWAKAGGTVSRCVVTGSGAWVTCAMSITWGLLPAKGEAPASNS